MRTIIRETLLWLLTALGGVTMCVGLWDCWLSHHVLLLVIGSAMIGLVVLTRYWARREDRPADHPELPIFVAIILCAPALATIAYGVSLVLLMATIGSIGSSERPSGLVMPISLAAALVAAAIFIQREFARERRTGKPD